MPADLRHITDFQDLLAYLRDELDWPVDDHSIDDLTFEYDADELGLKDEEAAKLRDGRIRQLRPLPGGQPFGIFFVEFGQAKLPVVVLRRILNALVIKKRNSTDQQRWEAADLLFISSFGESDDREIAFAHFHKDPDTTELPVLRVLGWDGSDTPLKLEHVAKVLAGRLRWPENPDDQEAWRSQWRGAFRHRLGHVIKTANDLADALAGFARKIRDAATTIMAHESAAKGQLRKLHKAFQSALIHDLTEADFADTYAQTVTYGLLTAAISRTEMSAGRHGTALSPDDITAMVPVTNPFLKEMLQEFLKVGGRRGGVDFDELGINEVVELLRGDETDLPAILRDFGNRKPGEDPVIHFYETFLAAYNKKLRIQRGVFYTPQPVVGYIVRSVHELLQTEFGLEDGLASIVTWGEMILRNPELKLPPLTDMPGESRTISPDEPFVQILDPATGTATFLVECIDIIHKQLCTKWKAEGKLDLEFRALWNDYVPKHLLPRLHGYELMMAPYAIAHMKIGLKLAETGYRFGTEQRARIYLTNALEPTVTQLPTWGFAALAHSAAAVNEIKWYKRFTVVIGNPPYSSLSQNMSEWARGIVDFYFHDDSGRMAERGNRNQLQDDYVKFFRLGQLVIDATGVGTLAFISNSSYTKGPWFRGMRYQLTLGFDRISILDLHGSKAHSLDSQEGDQNVFEITTQVSIGILRRHTARHLQACLVTYADVHGSRDWKYARLAETSVKNESQHLLAPTKVNQWRFVPHDGKNYEEWGEYISLPEIFVSWGAGVLTNRNGLAIADTRNEVLRKAQRFADLTVSDAEIESEFSFSSNYQWNTGKARKEFAKSAVTDLAEPYTFRPFDFQFIYWHKNIVYNMRGDKMKVFRGVPRPIALMFSRNTKHGSYTNIYVTNCIADRHCLEEANVAPLYSSADDAILFSGHKIERRSNLAESFVSDVATRLQQTGTAIFPEEIFHYMYAVFHSPGYRSRYAEFLKIDFPRLPLTSSIDLFRELSRLGGELVALHLLESPTLDTPRSAYIGDNRVVSKVLWTPEEGGTVWIDGAGTKAAPRPGSSGFRPVPEEVWNFHIGGYQVCEKWLKDRKGRTLSDEDLAHYHKIVIALTETIRLMAEIDEVIETHGGWPGAFQSDMESPPS